MEKKILYNKTTLQERKRQMKRCAALLLCLLLCAGLFFGCEKQSAVPLRVGETAFSKGVFAYILNETMKGAPESAAREDVLASAARACAVYAALEEQLRTLSVKLPAEQKQQAAQRTRGLWQYFSAHYRALGMEKSDLTTVCTWEAAKQALALHLYGEGGKEEVSQKKLRTWFGETYAGYRGFSESLFKTNAKGETVPLSDAEKKELTAQLEALRLRAQNGETLDALYKEYSKAKGLLITTDMEVTELKKGDPTVNEAFFEKVRALKKNKIAVLENGSALVLLQRIDLLAKDTPYFDAAKDDVLLAKKLPAVEEALQTKAQTMDAQTDARLCAEIYERVKATR